MPRESIAAPQASVADANAKNLTASISVERRPINAGRSNRGANRPGYEDLSNFAFCPLPTDYFDFALNRGLRGQETRVFEVSSWNSEQPARFRVKS